MTPRQAKLELNPQVAEGLMVFEGVAAGSIPAVSPLTPGLSQWAHAEQHDVPGEQFIGPEARQRVV